MGKGGGWGYQVTTFVGLGAYHGFEKRLKEKQINEICNLSMAYM